jgi:hypothetical protein
MKNTQLRLSLFAAASALALLWTAPSARANVYATDIKLNGSLTSSTVGAGSGEPFTITFILNQAATYGTTISILSSGNPVRTLTIASGSQGTLHGLNTVTWDGNDSTGNPIAAGTYTLSITAAAASLGSSWTQFTVNAKSNSLNSAFGLAINNNPASAYYGRVFVGNKVAGTSTPGNACPIGIMKLNADCSQADEGLWSGTPTGYTWHSGYDPFGLRYGQDDKLYFLEFYLQGDIWACDMKVTTATHVLQAANYASGPSIVNNGYGWRSFDVIGSGSNGKFFLGDADSNSGTYGHGAGVYYWPMVNGLASGSSGTQVVAEGTGSSQLLLAGGGIFVATNNTVYVGQQLGSPYGYGDQVSIGSSAPAVEAFNWNGSTTVSTADIWAADANNSNFQENWDIALDSRTSPNYVAVPFAEGTSGNGGVQVLSASTGSQVTLIDNNEEYWGLAFDGVGNLYGAESTHGYVRGYSPPGNSTNTTVAYGSIVISNAPPTITQQPQPSSLTTNQGANLTLTVTASGTPPLAYQWTKNGASLATQTTTSLALLNLQATDTGSYAVVITNFYGAVTSSAVNLTVAAKPVIVQQPQSMFTYLGGAASFSVTASGSQPLSYQWSLGGSTLSGATLSSYNLTGATALNAGSYTCLVTNIYGTTNSAAGVLTVLNAATTDGYANEILNNPSDGTPMAYYRLDETRGTVAHDVWGGYNGIYNNVALNQPGFSCIDSDPAAGFGTLLPTNSYVGGILGIDGFAATTDTTAFSLEAWVNGPASQTGGAGIIAKGTGNGGEQFNLDVYTGGVYRFFVRDSTGAIPNGTLVASVGPNGAWQHVVAVYDGANSLGGGSLLYLYVNGVLAGTQAASAAGILSSTHEVSIGARQSGSGAYDFNFNGTIDEVAIYNTALNGTQVYNHYSAYCNWPTFAPLICQQPQPAGPVYPQPLSGTPAVNATFSVQACGDPSFTYQWYFGGNPIEGAQGSSYTINGVAPSSAGTYSCAITNNYGGIVSAGARLTVLPTNSYVAAITGDGPVSYWRLDETNGSIAHDYWGGNNGTYNNVTLGLPGYSVADTDPCIGLPANPANRGYVQVANYSPFTFAGSAAFTFEGWACFTNLTGVQRLFSTMTLASPYGYGFGINGANELVFTTAGNTDSDQPLSAPLVTGVWYHLVCANDGYNYYFYVNGQPVGSQAVTSNSGVGVPLQLGANPAGWTVAGEQVNGRLDEMAIYNVALTADQVLAHYNARPLPAVPVAPTPVIITGGTNYAGLSATIQENASGQALSYQWYKAPATLLSGATASTLTLPSLATTDAGSYYVNVSNQSGATNTPAVALTVWAVPTNASQLNLTKGLVLHLPFDGDYNDISGRGHNGTPVGAPSFVSSPTVTPAVGSSALSYSSTVGGPYNYVTLGVVPDLEFGASTDFSVSYWVQQPTGTTYYTNLPFFTVAVGSTGNGGFAFAPGVTTAGVPTGGWMWTIGSVSDPSIYSAFNYNTINDGNWHHLAHVAQRSANCTTYLDGVPVDAQPIVEAGTVTTAYAATIGQDPTGTYPATAGAYVNDLAVWTNTLTPLQVSGIYLAGSVNHVGVAPPVPAPATISISGTTLSYRGGNGSQFVLLSNNVATASLSTWARVATNAVPPTSGTFTIPAVGSGSGPVFYSLKSE